MLFVTAALYIERRTADVPALIAFEEVVFVTSGGGATVISFVSIRRVLLVVVGEVTGLDLSGAGCAAGG